MTLAAISIEDYVRELETAKIISRWVQISIVKDTL
jgi:hypothetical protein